MSGLFISYRRSDSAPWAGRLRDRLVAELPERRVFFDIDNISLGVDFRKVIADTLAECGDVLLLIGPGWLARDGEGVRRIDDEADLHRVEVESALRSGARLIPILVGGSSMPQADDLPASMRELAFRNAHAIDHASFGRDTEVLVRALHQPTSSANVPPVRPVAEVSTAPTTPTAPNLVRPEPPAPTQSPAPRRISGALIGAVAAVAAAVTIGVVVLGGGSDDTDEQSSAVSEPSAGDTTAASLVTAAAATAATPSTGAPESEPERVVLPDATIIYDQPVDDAVESLEAAGLVVEVEPSGCSNSSQPGFVRRVTASPDLDTGILYGKPGDAFDLEAAARLRPGDVVTVWTPTANPC